MSEPMHPAQQRTPTEPRANTYGRWFSVILLDYYETEAFWDRDAGLLYDGLRALGIDARFVAIGDPAKFRREGLVLGSLAQLQTPEWWKQWNLEGVLLYSWGLPKFTPVAAAIKAAGVHVVLIMDTGGYVAPRVWPWMFWRIKAVVARQQSPLVPGLRAFARTLMAWPNAKHRSVVDHLGYADLIALPSTLAKQRYARFLRQLHRDDIAKRCAMVPYPVSSRMVCNPAAQKSKAIVAVGAWRRLQKNPVAMIKTLQRVLAERPDYSAITVGSGHDYMEHLARWLDTGARARLVISPPVPNEQLVKVYQESRIILCSSYYESFHIATAEALCCGCSFVGDARISSMPYFASIAGFGTLSCDASVRHLGDAVLAEIDLWELGFRNPQTISDRWTNLLHPQQVARQALESAKRLQALNQH